ncbi:hypothetical protein NMG60_11023772 [Bertholletia excelsa]
MATESPIRILESGKWPSHGEANMSSEELQLLLRGQRFEGNTRVAVPNRSESAPPSMEGSLAAIEKLGSKQDSSINGAIGSFESEEKFHADPAYLPYYCSNANLNPRLPPPLISSENRHLVHRVGSIGNRWGLTSYNDTGNLLLSQSNLPTHEEESEDDRSPQRGSDDWADGDGLWSGQDLQGDFPSSSSRVYNQSRSLSHELGEGSVDCDADSSSLRGPSFSKSKSIKSTPGANDTKLSLRTDLPEANMSCSSSFESTGSTTDNPPLISRNPNSLGARLEVEALTGNVAESDVTCIESKMKTMNISRLQNSDAYKNQSSWQNSHPNSMGQPQVYPQLKHESQVQVSKSQMVSQGVNQAYTGMNQFLHGPSSFSSSEVQPILQSSGFTPTLYHPGAAAYMASANPFYPNFQPSGYFTPQYGVGGYTLNTAALPTLLAGYPFHNAVPVGYDGTAGPSLSSQTSGTSAGGSIVHGVDMQQLNKFYGQYGFAMQTSLADPFHLQYTQQPTGDAYNFSGQVDPYASRAGGIANQSSASNSQSPHQGSVGLINQNSRRGGISSSHYYGSPINTSIPMPFQTSPIASPVLPGSSVGGPGFPGGRSEASFSPVSGRNNGIYPRWQGPRGVESFNDMRIYSLLEELKSGKGQRFELSDIAGHIVEFSADQHGSRFIQQKLECCCGEEKASVFKEVLPHASKLMTDVFGNYVIQKFFEYGSPEQTKELANQLERQVLSLSMQMYGCRVIQKALEVIELEQKIKLVKELDGHVMHCVLDQNGNHVIQKCIESIPTDKIGFVISAFRGHVATLSMHPYGCRVIQRVLEHCTDELQSQFIVDEILESVYALAHNQYGNYVTQHVLERGKPHERSQIISKLSGCVVQMSQHKFASNVVEKCLEHGDHASREMLIEEIIGQNDGNDNLLIMMKDQYANYVVQKILQTCTDSQREVLLSCISVHLNALKNYTYGKHIVARFGQLYGEEHSKSE